MASGDRTADIIGRARELLRAGVVMAVVAGVISEDDTLSLRDAGLPAVVIDIKTDLTSLRSDIERFIARRRRELFSLDGELHRTLIEASIAGASLVDLAAEGARHAQSPVLVDRGGDIVVHPPKTHITHDLLRMVREAAAQGGIGSTAGDGGPEVLASPVTSGSEVRGVVALLEVDRTRLDDLEAVVVNLASACAIALSREPSQPLPTLDDILKLPADSLLDARPWIAAALRGSPSVNAGLRRALAAELDARAVTHAFIMHAGSPVVLAATDDRFPWEAVIGAASTRLAALDLQAGLSRPQVGRERSFEAVRQAIEALTRGRGAKVTCYGDVELDSLLGSVEGADAFVQARLGRLLDGAPGNLELLQTLAQYLQTGRNAKEAANRLAVHRNTLIYRLRRLENILGIEWNDADAVFALDLALRLRGSGTTQRGGSGFGSK